MASVKSKSVYIASILILMVSISATVYGYHTDPINNQPGFTVNHHSDGEIIGSGLFTTSDNINFGNFNLTNVSHFQADVWKMPSCSEGQLMRSSDNNGNIDCVDASSVITVQANYTETFPGFDTNVTIPSDIVIRSISGSFHLTPGVSVPRSIDMQVSCNGENFQTVQKLRVPSSFTNGIHQGFSFSAEGGCVYRFHENETGGTADSSGYSFVEWKV